MMDLNNPFWRFCITSWQDSVVADFAIEQSIEAETDVVGVFFFIYCRHKGACIDTAKVAQAKRRYRPMISAYRQLRRTSKGNVDSSLYKQQKQLELSAEQHYAKALYQSITPLGDTADFNSLTSDEKNLYQFAVSRMDRQ